MRLYIGLMSGTSMDGIDAALVDVETHRCIAGITLGYSESTQQRLTKLSSSSQFFMNEYHALHRQLGEEFAEAACQLMKKVGLTAKDVIAIGSHGQTICHDACHNPPYTVQLACPHTIAERTGLTVVADFRTRDMILGGQGAPFAPIYHQAIFAEDGEPIAVVNIGGISNISCLKNGEVSGYDIGPGNCLLDAWINKCLQQNYDRRGEWGRAGQIINTLLDNLRADSFFQKLPPKSIGKEYFSLAWLNQFLSPEFQAIDVQNTLTQLSADMIVEAVQEFSPAGKLFLCGGGVHNEFLVELIEAQLPTYRVASTAEIQIDPDYLEAMMFAWLADKALHYEAIDMTTITGASQSSILGAIYPIKGLTKKVIAV